MLAAMLLLVQAAPLIRAHAHNDYAQARPLFGAMELGFCSIEADVYLVDGKLLVGHNRKDLKADHTLDSMYLRPLSVAVKANRGKVFAQPAEVILLVDIKADGPGVYEELKKELRPYDSWLTHYKNGKVQKRAVTVILSGERPTAVLAAEKARVAFIDGRPDDVNPSFELTPLVSESWDTLFKWNGLGEMPALERQKLDALVQVSHSRGQKLRFWATPDLEGMWRVLYEAGVDLIGADRQRALADFLRSRR